MEGKEFNATFSVKEFIDRPGSNFKWVRRIDFRSMEDSVVEEQVYKKGLPLVISNTTVSWKRDKQLFSFEWLKEKWGHTMIKPRDNDTFEDREERALSQYIDYIYKPEKERATRLYGKDVPCPTEWKDYIRSKLPNYWVKGEQDLMSKLMSELQAETLLIYVGPANTCTPGHVDILGSLGHNVMVTADEGAYALWFMISAEDRDKALRFGDNALVVLYFLISSIFI